MNLDRSTMQALALASQIGFSIAVPLIAAIFGGILLDRALGTAPLFLVIGILIGLVLAALTLYRLVLYRSPARKSGDKQDDDVREPR